MQYALMRGWTYTAEDDSLVGRWQGEPFGRGDHQRARERAHRQRVAAARSPRSTTPTRRSRPTRRATAARPRTTGPCARCRCRPGSASCRWCRSRSSSGWPAPSGLMQDIDLESEDFNRRYRVTAGNPKFATDVLPPRTMEYLLTVDIGGWRICGGDIAGLPGGPARPAGGGQDGRRARTGARRRTRVRLEGHGRPGNRIQSADHDRALDRHRDRRRAGDRCRRLVQPVRPPAQPGAGVVAAGRRRADPAPRPGPEPRRDGQGLRHPRARGLRGGDRGPGRGGRARRDARPSRPSRRTSWARRSAGCSPSPRPTRTSRRAPTSSSCSAS